MLCNLKFRILITHPPPPPGLNFAPINLSVSKMYEDAISTYECYISKHN